MRSNVNEESKKQKLANMEGQKHLVKMLFDKTCERWRGLLYALHKDDREQLLIMLVDSCSDSLDDGAAKMHKRKSFRNLYFCFFLFLFCFTESKTNRPE